MKNRHVNHVTNVESYWLRILAMRALRVGAGTRLTPADSRVHIT